MADFKNLRVWRNAHALSLNVDKTARRIRKADYAPLRRQMIRAAQSVPANIVEGREKSSEADFARFLEIAKGSASELEQHLIAARDLELISHSDFHSLTSQIEEVRKMLTGLLDCLRQSIEDTRRRQKPGYRAERGESSAVSQKR